MINHSFTESQVLLHVPDEPTLTDRRTPRAGDAGGSLPFDDELSVLAGRVVGRLALIHLQKTGHSLSPGIREEMACAARAAMVPFFAGENREATYKEWLRVEHKRFARMKAKYPRSAKLAKVLARLEQCKTNPKLAPLRAARRAARRELYHTRTETEVSISPAGLRGLAETMVSLDRTPEERPVSCSEFKQVARWYVATRRKRFRDAQCHPGGPAHFAKHDLAQLRRFAECALGKRPACELCEGFKVEKSDCKARRAYLRRLRLYRKIYFSEVPRI